MSQTYTSESKFYDIWPTLRNVKDMSKTCLWLSQLSGTRVCLFAVQCNGGAILDICEVGYLYSSAQ